MGRFKAIKISISWLTRVQFSSHYMTSKLFSNNHRIKNILYIASLFPEPNSSAAGVHTYQMLRAIEKCKSLAPAQKVNLFYCAPQQESEHAQELEKFFNSKQESILYKTRTIKPNDTKCMDEIISEAEPDLCIFGLHLYLLSIFNC